MRWDQEHGWDYYGPATLVDIRGAVDANGKITAYDYALVPAAVGLDEATAYMAGRPLPTSAASAAPTSRTRATSTRSRNHRVHRPRSIPNDSQLPKVAYLRAPARTQALFASRADDRRARVRGDDGPGRVPEAEHRELPVARRARGGGQGRELEAAVARLERSTSGRITKGRGVAIGGFASTFVGDRRRDRGRHEDRQDPRQARLRRARLRPDHQPEDGRAAGRRLRRSRASAARSSRRSSSPKSRVTSLDWDVVPDPALQGRAGDHDRAREPAGRCRSSGSGEPATAPVAAAIANAFFDATGKRIRTMPMTPARVRDVLEGVTRGQRDDGGRARSRRPAPYPPSVLTLRARADAAPLRRLGARTSRAATLPARGVLAPGKSLGGVRLGDTQAAVQRAAGGRLHGSARVCALPTWLYTYRGGGAAGRRGLVPERAASRPSSRSACRAAGARPEGLALGDPRRRGARASTAPCPGAAASATARSASAGRASSRSIYTYGESVYGFALTRPSEPSASNLRK